MRLCSSATGGGLRVLSRSEQLLRERMRATGRGITKYQYVREEDRLLVVDGPKCSLVQRETVSENSHRGQRSLDGAELKPDF